MEPGNLQRLCGTPGARSGQARHQSEDSCPSYDDFRPGSRVRGVRVLDGVRWRKGDMMRVDGAWKPAEAVRDPRGPIWPGATSIQGFLPELGRFEAGFDGACGGRVLDGVRWRK